MVSDLAISEVDAMRRRGLDPSVADIVRLNALALAISHGPYAAYQFALPRVAFLPGADGGDLVLREPTIAHEIWLAKVRQTVDMDDESAFACRLYAAATMDAATLPDPYNREAVKSAVEGALARFGRNTFSAVRLALEYVITGGLHTDGEYATVPECEAPTDDAILESVAVGVVKDAMSMKLGISLRDALRMTRGQLLEIIYSASGADMKGSESGKRRRVAFFRTVDEITARLEAERTGADDGNR